MQYYWFKPWNYSAYSILVSTSSPSPTHPALALVPFPIFLSLPGHMLHSFWNSGANSKKSVEWWLCSDKDAPSYLLLVFTLSLPWFVGITLVHLLSGQQREAERYIKTTLFSQPALCRVPFQAQPTLTGAKGLLAFLDPAFKLLPLLVERGCPWPLLTVSCCLVTTW